MRGSHTDVTGGAGGITAGVTTVTVVNPIWVIKTRLQLQGAAQLQARASAAGARADGLVYQGSWDALRQIVRDEGVRGGMWGGGGPEVKEGKVGGGYGVGNGKESEEEGEEGDDVEREGSASFMGRRRRRLKKGGAVDSKVLNFADNIHGGGTLDSPVQSLTFRAAGSGDTLDVSGLSQAILIRIPMRTVPTTPEESANMSFPKRVICLPNVSHTLTISCGNGTNIYYECLANQTNTNTSTTTSTGTGTGTSAKSTAKNEENASDPSPLTLTCPTVVEQPR